MMAPSTTKGNETMGERQEVWEFRLGQGLFTDVLGSDLYTDYGRCAAEGYRNGAVACMRGDDDWDPKRIAVDLAVVQRHPLTGGRVLMITDHGSGFTKADIERFCVIGSDGEGSTRHGGAAQKRVGRFALLALSRRERTDRMFIILTRTSATGPVTMVEITPTALTAARVQPQRLAVDAKELGTLANHRGSFSAIIIPDPVFVTNEELQTAIAPYLPRKGDDCGATTIGGKPFVPPPLANAIALKPPRAPNVEAYLARSPKGTSGGIWLVDATTGFRVGFGPNVGARLPYPLARPDLEGDIFLPGLLAQQDTSRGGLAHRFLASKAWQRLHDLLVAEVCESARGLLEEDDVIERSSVGRTLAGFRDLFIRAFGAPKGGDLDIDAPPPPGIGPRNPKDPPPGPRPPRGPATGGGGPHKRRSFRWNIGNREWIITSTRDDPDVFAVARLQPDGATGIVYTNNAYDLHPRAKGANEEHVLLQLLAAVARADHPYDAAAAAKLVAEWRRTLIGLQ